MPGWDGAAHAYKVFLLRNGEGVFRDDYWYGGSYGAITYGFVYYALAQYVPGAVLVTDRGRPASALLLRLPAWRVDADDVWPAWLFIAVMCMYQAHGQDPFVFALCLTMAGLALLGSGRPVLAALVVGVSVFANPMALFVGACFLLGTSPVVRTSGAATSCSPPA